MEQMTELSRQMFDRATRVRTVAQAVQVLETYGAFRRLGDILRTFSGQANPKGMLVDGILERTPGANREAVDRKVRNWLSGRTGTVAREEAFLLSRVLGLSLEKTDDFLKQVTGEGIHWRNPEEIVWGYGIVNSLSCERIVSLQNRAKNLLPTARQERNAPSDRYTADVREKLEPMLRQPEEEFLNFLALQRENFGTLHNTAYRLFKQYMELLESGGADTVAESTRMKSQEVLEEYLYRKLVPVAKRGEKKSKDLFSDLQRSIRANWPDDATISKMKHREMDVSRKVLILLFLATDGCESEYEEYDEDEDILTRDEVFENIYTRLNRMLHACGFQMLDPRSAFDWTVLFCICVEDLWDVDSRLRGMLQAMFPAREE